MIGLDPYRVPGPWDPEPVAEAVAAGMAALAERGFDAESCLVGLDGEDVAASVATALRAGPWDCVLVGGGLRHSEERLELFEDVVNLVHRHAPDAEIVFNATPHELADAVSRRIDRA